MTTTVAPALITFLRIHDRLLRSLKEQQNIAFTALEIKLNVDNLNISATYDHFWAIKIMSFEFFHNRV
jgi:hypothetical protein